MVCAKAPIMLLSTYWLSIFLSLHVRFWRRVRTSNPYSEEKLLSPKMNPRRRKVLFYAFIVDLFSLPNTCKFKRLSPPHQSSLLCIPKAHKLESTDAVREVDHVTTLFLLLLLLWTLELYLILSYRSLDHIDLILTILSWRSYLDDLILAILSRRSMILSWSLDLFIRWWSKIHFFYFITYMHLTCLWLMSFIYDWHAFYTCYCATCFYHMFYTCLPWGQHMDISI